MKAPEIKHYINWLGRVEYRNINCSFTYDEVSYEAIDRIFRLLHRLEPGPENNSWELWLRAERGTIEDFGSFEELRADGQVESFEGFETWWHSEFPEEAAWFHPLPPARIRRSDTGRYSWAIAMCWRWTAAKSAPSL